MGIIICVAVLRKEDRTGRPGEPIALWRESFWPHDLPDAGTSIWFKPLFPLTRFVYIEEVNILPPDDLRPFEKYEIEFQVSKWEFDMLWNNGWNTA